ncbi:MAG TPA: hypothetical protein VK616_07750, partial [Flavitalea sp.]|nr:hypothetical protein [Flavitalea sp.]
MHIKFYHRFYDLEDLAKMPSHQVYGALNLETHGVQVSFTEDFKNKNKIVRRLAVAYKFMFPDQQYEVVYGSTPNGLELLVLLRSLGLFRKPIVVWQHRALKTSK